MGGAAAVVGWKCRNVRAVVPWGGAVAGRCRESTAFEGDGAGDDIFHAAKLFLLGRIVRWLVAGLGLDEHRAGCAEKEKPTRTAHACRGESRVETGARAHGGFFASARIAGLERRGAILLPVARTCARRFLVGLGRASQ